MADPISAWLGSGYWLHCGVAGAAGGVVPAATVGQAAQAAAAAHEYV